jgi:ketosteroid isomerase-like protein
MIYRFVVAQKLRGAFAALNRGDHAPVLGAFGAPVEHVFYGVSALAGTRRDRPSITAWYARLKQVFPDLRFEIDAIAVSGMPWNTVALVEWRDSFTLPDGTRAGNQGVHVLRMAWGKVTSLRVYCDTQLLAIVLHEMQRQGRKEAGLAPIGDPRAGAQPPLPATPQPAFAAAARS